jgi:hypothetical protein
MKNTIKFLGIIALIAVIGFSMSSCDDGSSSGDIVPSELQGTWVGSYGTIIINSSSATVQTGGSSITDTVKRVQKGSVTNVDGVNYTVYTVKFAQWDDVILGLTSDKRTMVDNEGYFFYKQ